jgi:phosphoribosylamine---glycine ligase
MRVLVIGSGGREHAICMKLSQSPNVKKLYAAPGNAGISQVAELVDIKADDIEGLLNFVKVNYIDFTVVGPEVPLEAGIVDEFNKLEFPIFGPSKAAARLENSKVFAKDFMKRSGIPTAGYESFSASEKTAAALYLDKCSFPVVIKADGLAAGKGVIICNSHAEAIETLDELFDKKLFGSAGENIVIEDFLTGEEVSVFAICDGVNYVVLPSAQDHKKIGEGETGKNTGGMGSYAPAEKIMTPAMLENIKKKIIEPVLKNMKAAGHEFKGVLYCGLMITGEGEPYVIEFNTRFGDPETQVVLPLVKSDLLEMFIASANGTMKQYTLEVYNEYYACVVMASSGYPDKYETGKVISGLDSVSKDCIVFHAGTKRGAEGELLTAGGRVLNVVGKSAKGLKEAIDTAYQNVERIHFENEYYRKDIGIKGL